MRFLGSPGRYGAVVSGAFVGGVLMCGVALSHGASVALGSSAGAFLGGVLGYCVAAGRASVVTVFAVMFGLFFCMIGPSFDDYQGMVALPGALLGAVVGLLISIFFLTPAGPEKEQKRDVHEYREDSDNL